MDNKWKPGHKVRRIFFSFAFLLVLCCGKTYGQFYSVSLDGLGLATTTISVEGSMALNNKWSIHLPVLYNPWSFGENKKFKHLTLQPGARMWLVESYSTGWFIGMNGIVSNYNIGGVFGSKHRRYGWAYGGGFSAGYALAFHPRWNIEFELGVGAVWTRYDKYRCERCGEVEEHGVTKVFVSPNKAAVKLVYLF